MVVIDLWPIASAITLFGVEIVKIAVRRNRRFGVVPNEVPGDVAVIVLLLVVYPFDDDAVVGGFHRNFR